MDKDTAREHCLYENGKAYSLEGILALEETSFTIPKVYISLSFWIIWFEVCVYANLTFVVQI